MDKKPQTNIIISHRNEESAFMLRLFFALKGFKAEIQKSIEQALSPNAQSDPGTVLVCDASDQTLLRASKKNGKKLQNVVVMRDDTACLSAPSRISARVVSSSTVGQDLLDAVSDVSSHP